MNERILELAEQSLPNVKFWNEEITKGNTPPKNRAITLDELENFAELIVRECIEVCNSRVGNSDYNTGRMHCVSDLKEHFGVEE